MNTEKTFSQPLYINTSQEYKTIKNALEYFINNKKEALWEKNKEHWKKSFKSQLQLLKLYLDNNNFLINLYTCLNTNYSKV